MGTMPHMLLVHTVVVRRYLGTTATGERYAAAETVPCFYEDAKRRVQDTDGNEVTSSTTFYCLPDVATIPPRSEVDVNGRTTSVIIAHHRDGGGLPTPDHWEVNLL